MNDDRLKTAYQEALAGRTDDGPEVPLERLVALVEGTGSEDERLETLNLVMASPTLMAEFELLRAAAEGAGEGDQAPALATEGGDASEDGAQWRPLAVPIASRTALKAAALLVVALGIGIVWSQSRAPVGEPLRSGEANVVLVTPAAGAAVEATPTFVWRAHPGATGYRVEVLTEAGDVALDEATTDTTWVVAAEAALQSGTDYRWWVTATLPGGVEARAAARALRVR